MAIRPLPPGGLHRSCAAEALPFGTTAELADLEAPLGQDRAAAALELGTALRAPGYHVFVMGPAGVGKHALAGLALERRARSQRAADDWCYLGDFSAPQRPRAFRMPAGRACPFRRDMDALLEDLRAAIPAVFESEDYRTRLHVLETQLEESRERVMAAVQQHARARQLTVVRTPVGFMVAPTRGDEVLPPERFHQLPPEEQQQIQDDITHVQEELQAALRGMPQLEREHRARVKDLNREVALFAVDHLIEEVGRRHADLPQVGEYLAAVRGDVVEHVHDFLGAADGEDAASEIRKLFSESNELRRYRVNVMVQNAPDAGAPVVEEPVPSYPNLFGHIEHQARFGALVTDFTLIRPGALHRANGGYLVLDARRLLTQPLAWEQLKRALEAGHIRIQPPERLYGFSSATSLDPEPIALDVKVVLLGDRLIYELLSALDPEFLDHFKVAADLSDELPREGNELAYARIIAALARHERLRPVTRDGVARIIEHAARLTGDARKLTARLQRVSDLLREADHHAAAGQHPSVEPGDVEAALEAQRARHGRVRELVLEQIARGTVLIDTRGAAVGQVNALSVVQTGPFFAGRPSRVTARIRLGKGEVVDIEREVELGGPIHSKGVLILSSFLASHYAPDRPFALSASIVFEQSYGPVEGDSASCAELYALLSALSGVPLRQAIAVTGSVNQAGKVQPVGAVDEKVEGFFDVCRARGLTGAEGVVIPAGNADDLMLRREVVEAVAAGSFHVWAAEDVDDALELLTGLPAGERTATGEFSAGSVHARVAARLAALAAAAHAFATPAAAERQP